MDKKITLEDLAGMIAKGFNENSEQHRQIFDRFEKIDERFEKIDGRFEKIDGRFEHIEARLDLIEEDLSEIKEGTFSKDEKEDTLSRIDLLEKKVGVVSK